MVQSKCVCLVVFKTDKQIRVMKKRCNIKSKGTDLD